MEDKLSLILPILCAISLAILAIGIVKEYMQYVREKGINSARQMAIVLNPTEYERIQNSTIELESDFQPNSGDHHPEEVYVKRSELIRKETSWFKLVNSL